VVAAAVGRVCPCMSHSYYHMDDTIPYLSKKVNKKGPALNTGPHHYNPSERI
jgi:hypothetical protein